jgi:hypothetical protein
MTKEERIVYNKKYREAHKKTIFWGRGRPKISILEENNYIDEKRLIVIEEYCSVCKMELNFREKLFGKKCIKCTN